MCTKEIEIQAPLSRTFRIKMYENIARYRLFCRIYGRPITLEGKFWGFVIYELKDYTVMNGASYICRLFFVKLGIQNKWLMRNDFIAHKDWCPLTSAFNANREFTKPRRQQQLQRNVAYVPEL